MSIGEIFTLIVVAIVGACVIVLRSRAIDRENSRPPQTHSNVKPMPTYDEAKVAEVRNPDGMG